MGQCPQCGKWNTLDLRAETVEAAVPKTNLKAVRPAKLQPLKEVSSTQSERHVTGIGELG